MWVLPLDLTAAALARRHVEAACGGMPGDLVDVVRLLVTELVSNALRHGTGAPVLGVLRDETGLLVYVDDECSDPPVVREPADWMEHGAGMRLVVALADDWGVAPREEGLPGKRVWFAVG